MTMMLTVNENLKAGERSTIHKFELAGLGKAPFHFTGQVSEKTYQACNGAPVQPASTCDYCGTCIRYEFWVKSADKKEFKVGCDCIRKSDDAGLIQQISKAERELKNAKNVAARKTRLAKKADRIEAAKSLFPMVQDTLANEPHPSDYFARQGKSLADYVVWCLDNGVEAGAAIVEKAAR
jgi:hypothetical protein